MDINVDMGESYGRWQLGDDADVMPWITSANIACGFHAGDPATMRASVLLAIEHDVAIGAHVGLPDLLGFGRRRMDVSVADVRDYAAYQLGALNAIATSEGATLSHVKPHGALYALCSSQSEYAAAIAEAVAGVDASLALLLLSKRVAPAVAQHGVELVVEAFPDLEYRPTGELVIEPVKRAWEPDRVARRAVRVACDRQIDANDSSDLDVTAPTLCLHGDAPNAAHVAQTVRQALEAAGVTVQPLRQHLSR